MDWVLKQDVEIENAKKSTWNVREVTHFKRKVKEEAEEEQLFWS